MGTTPWKDLFPINNVAACARYLAGQGDCDLEALIIESYAKGLLVELSGRTPGSLRRSAELRFISMLVVEKDDHGPRGFRIEVVAPMDYDPGELLEVTYAIVRAQRHTGPGLEPKAYAKLSQAEARVALVITRDHRGRKRYPLCLHHPDLRADKVVDILQCGVAGYFMELERRQHEPDDVSPRLLRSQGSRLLH